MRYLATVLLVAGWPTWFAVAAEKEKGELPPQVAGVFDLANAPSVVFLCDSSGSMMTEFDSVRGQFRRAVEALRPGQTFNIMFWSEGRVTAVDAKMLTANDANRKRAFEFLEKTAPHGSADPLPGIEAAFKLRPSVIYVMTNGDLPNNDQVREVVAKLNADKKVRVNTIGMVNHEEGYEKFLKRLAAENGGSYRFADAKELAGTPEKAEKPAEAAKEPQIAGIFDLGNAESVVFLCDSSGSMMTKFDSLRQQLRKGAEALRPGQSFNIVFFSEDGFLALDKKKLLPADDASRRKCFDMLDRTAPHGSSNPIPGLKVAFGLQPKLVILLTDGDFPNNNEVVEAIRKLNKDKKVKVNTIAFIDRDESYEKFLKQVAAENGGAFRVVEDKDLGEK